MYFSSQNTLNVPDDFGFGDHVEMANIVEEPEVRQNRASFLRMKRRSLASTSTYDRLHTVNNIINGGSLPKHSTTNTLRSRKSPQGSKRRQSLH